MACKRREESAARRTAKRLGLPEHDVAEPDAMSDLGYRVEIKDDVRFDKTPLKPHHVTPPPELGEEPWDRYPLERDRAPVTGEVSLETDVALGLEEDVHREKPRKTGKEREGDRRGTA